METVSVSLSPLQTYLAVVIQMWIIIAPILIIRKLNHLTNLVEQQVYTDEESS